MKRGAKPGVRRVDAGVPRPRKWGPEPLHSPPADPAEVALNGSFRRGDVDEAEWARLRVAAWQRWRELVTVTVEQKTDDFRDPARGPLRDWPPRGARHDGIEGQALSCWYDERHADGPERQRGWAEEGLEELRRFREQNPEATEQIAEARRIREPAARGPR